MKIGFTGGGTGGHFYPLIAVAQELHKILDEEKIVDATFYYFSDVPYDEVALFETEMRFVKITAGKKRLYRSWENIRDYFKVGWGILVALRQLYRIYPDVIFGKGGYASFPTLMAARLLGIPVVLHESDSAPGRVIQIAARSAKYLALSFSEAEPYFKNTKAEIIHTGPPLRRDIVKPITEGAREYLKLEPETPVLFILGASSGALVINDTIMAALPELLKTFQVIHQTGSQHIEDVEKQAHSQLESDPFKKRYHPYAFLNPLAMRMAAGVASVIAARAGSSTIFEIAAWGIPSVLIPITVSNLDHQRKNAYNYARTGAAFVIEEGNLSPHLLTTELLRIQHDEELSQQMSEAALQFAKPNAARTIAEMLLTIALRHEKD
ncbi:MAG: UDP-N-acetylglucosamine--N-acetylmuramyl-(pentapeptide) pyrophosphoryl-undecaprenol N-acetylglucosamine transferase [Planctomycetota bacterium]|jgi:UDP-N-acetylglucosamine--N-acetylmuramyl-(pentapeptide) pyrophosphoryl-undecaprenol N-acetylglucosamine transferase